jgi:hypothetical protein
VSERRSIRVTLLALTALTLTAGCGDNPLGPFQPEISSFAGTFELQATGVTGVTANEPYAWDSDGSPANVNQATVATSGAASVRIEDANGGTVYIRDLTDNGTFQTSSGAPGTWTIYLTLEEFSGDLNFRVETP